MLLFLQSFFVFFFLILFLGYLLPASLAYNYLYKWRKETWSPLRIQKQATPSLGTIRRDQMASVLSVFIFSALSTILYLLINNEYGLMYFQIADYGWLYAFLSFFAAIFIHDFYFYWIHRLMHHKAIFKYVHKLHHKTTTPTPWTIYAFQPLEAIIQYSIIYILVFVIPVHPMVLFTFITYNIIANVGGHCGFEITNPNNENHSILKYLNTVTHHDLHHSNCQYNYSQYFNFLDRWMKTFKEK